MAILPICGVLLFATGTYESIRANRSFHDGTGRYFWWSAVRLDSDPLNRHSSHHDPIACPDNAEGCLPVDLVNILMEPGWMAKCFMLSALPAFLGTKEIVHALARLGVSEVTSFFISMPLLTLGWFYCVGWGLDRWKLSRSRT